MGSLSVSVYTNEKKNCKEVKKLCKKSSGSRQLENSFTGHLGGVVLNKRNWKDLFVTVISAYPVLLAGGCSVLTSGNISVHRRQAKPALNILELMFNPKKPPKICKYSRTATVMYKSYTGAVVVPHNRTSSHLQDTVAQPVTHGAQWRLGRYKKEKYEIWDMRKSA